MGLERLLDLLRVHLLAAGDTARALCARPAWIRGIDHRIEAYALGVRDLTDSPSARLAARRAGAFERPVDTAEPHAPFTSQEVVLRRALGLGDDVRVNPSGGALAANPVMAAGPTRLGEAAARTHRGESDRALANATSGPCPPDPRREIDAVEMYVPFSWYEPMWLENLGFAEVGEGWQLTEAGVTELDGDLPVNPSGGVLSADPIGASGMIRFAEAALQVRGRAGERQIDGAARALGRAYGGGAQFFAMWLVGAEPPPG